jgi:hypothetical protein
MVSLAIAALSFLNFEAVSMSRHTGGLPMKKTCRILLALCLGLVLAGCAAMAPVPEGSQPMGTYQGLMWGGIEGPIQVTLFQTPKGDIVFSGQYVDSSNGGVGHFRGAVFGNAMEGKIDFALGDISGQLSPDSSQMSGLLKFAQYHSNWSATLQ